MSRALLAAGAAALCLGIADASAADNWAGPYVGADFGFAGGNWGVTENTTNFNTDLVTVLDRRSFATTIGQGGAVGGLHAGYLFRVGPVLVGGEADGELASFTRTGVGLLTQTQFNSAGTPTSSFFLTNQGKTSVDWLASLRARAGYDLGSWLLYGSAGLAAISIGYEANPSFGFFSPISTTKSLVGFAGGVGIAYAATPGLSLRIEYLHYEFPDLTTQVQQRPNGGGLFVDSIRIRSPGLEVVRAGFDLRF